MGGPATAAYVPVPRVTAVGPDLAVYIGARDGVYRVSAPFSASSRARPETS